MILFILRINISNVRAHGGKAGMLHSRLDRLCKCTVVVVDIKVIVLVKIVGNVHVEPVIVIYITDCNAKTKTDQTTINARRFAHVGKMCTVIPE